jgi:hypothetical protein
MGAANVQRAFIRYGGQLTHAQMRLLVWMCVVALDPTPGRERPCEYFQPWTAQAEALGYQLPSNLFATDTESVRRLRAAKRNTAKVRGELESAGAIKRIQASAPRRCATWLVNVNG